MEELLQKQKRSIEKLNQWVERFDRGDPETLLIRKCKDRVLKLEEWLKDFNKCNSELVPYHTMEQPYFAEDKYTAALQKYCSFMTKLQLQVNLDDTNPSQMLTDDEATDGSSSSDDEPNGEVQSEKELALDTQEKLEVLKLQRNDVKNVLSAIDKMKPNTSSGYAKAQIEMAKTVWDDYRAAHFEMRALNIDIDKRMNFKQLQQRYVQAIGKLHDMCSHGNGKEPYKVQLPKITLPEFSGKQDEWQPFIELFKKIVHDQKSLSDTIKMQYLKMCLKEDAEKLVKHVAPTGDNYKTCFEMLHKRYENKRQILGHLLDQILNLPKQKNENSLQLKTLHDTTVECIMAIKNLKINVTYWDPLVNHILLHKLSSETIRDYECQLADVREPQSLQAFLKFIHTRFMALQSADSKNVCTPNEKKPSQVTAKCLYCQQAHFTSKCSEFVKLDTTERHSWVKKENLCFNCLYRHKPNECKSKGSCNVCNKKHHTLLHFTKKNENEKKNVHCTAVDECNSDDDQIKIDETTVHNATWDTNALLPTALVYVIASNGEKVILRTLIDQCSQSNFITENAVQLLGLKKRRLSHKIFGIGAVPTVTTGQVEFEIRSRMPNEISIYANATVLSQVTKFRKPEKIPTSSYQHLKNIELADPDMNEKQPIDLLLGVSVFSKIIKHGLIKGNDNEPIAQNTAFGWMISGDGFRNASRTQVFVTALVSTEDIDKKLSQFFETEDTSDEKQRTEEEIFCEEHFKNTHKRTIDGKYVVMMPFKNNIPPNLGESRKCAVATLFQLEKRFKRNSELFAQYKQFIHEYISLGHMELASDFQGIRHYLPHHAVVKDSTTTKLRTVFNASQPTSNGVKLNDCLAIGRIEQKDIIGLIIQWRQFRYAFTADIEKMYRMIAIDKSQHGYQMILWRDSPDDKIQEFILKTLTYGMAPAPFIATRVLKQLAHDVKDKYPIASNIILSSFYMDDVNHGAHTEHEAKEMYEQLTKTMTEAGFNLRKWSSNSKRLKSIIPNDQQELNSNQNKVKTLGIIWNTETDMLEVAININIKNVPNSKRELLSEIASLYDPLGWIGPVVIKAKILLQQLWHQNIKWDEKLPDDIINEWMKIKNLMISVQSFQIPRWYGVSNNDQSEIHGFCDSSELAYAAVIYIKNEHGTHLICAKTKVAPIKKLTIPRLELCGAHLLSKLVKQVSGNLDFKPKKITLWCDSKIVLAWINGNPKRWTTFVMNKVIKINENAEKINWCHIPTKYNPADCASRGLYGNELLDHTLWWHGPNFSEIKIQNERNETEEELKRHAFVIEQEPRSIIPNISSLKRLRVIFAYVARFINNCKKECGKKTGKIDTTDIEAGNKCLVKALQFINFGNEIVALQDNKNISSKSPLMKLSVFLDTDNVLRVGGRLENADIAFVTKHQILLPKNDFVTDLIIQEMHGKCLHGGPTLTAATIRQKFWVINGVSNVKRVLSKCLTCHRHRCKPMQQQMAHLPAERVNIVEKGFYNTALDYAGPIKIKSSKLRTGAILKAYIAIFVCMLTKAMHIELVSDLTAEAFIAAFRRFIGRRGHIKNLYSDNATCFVSANKILNITSEVEKDEYNKTIFSELINNNVSWHFSPPAGPHFNGLAEAAVKTVKTHLKKSIGDIALTFEELATLLCQIEAVVNSRPITPMSCDPNDVSVITPGHLLIGCPPSALPDENLEDQKTNRLNRWQLIQKIQQNFWRRWQLEYLTLLQTKAKWFEARPEVNENDLILIHDENTPATQWPLGRVIKKHPGSDGLTRVVTIKTQNNILKRPITKISPLPINSSPNTSNSPANALVLTKKQKKIKFTAIHLITAVLAIMNTISCQPVMNSAVRIQHFNQNPCLFFEQEATIYVSTTNWNIIAIFGLNHFEEELTHITKRLNQMDKICNNVLTNDTLCKDTMYMAKQRLTDIVEKNDIIYPKNYRIYKRALLDVVGNIGRDLFGILDSRFQKEYVEDHTKLLKNDDHLMQLIQNQTTIIDSTLNIVKNNEYEIFRQDTVLAELNKQIQENHRTNMASQQFAIASVQMEHILNKYEEQQNDIIEVLAHTNKQTIAMHILTQRQWNQQIDIIRDTVSSQMAPELNIYGTVKVKTYRYGKNIFFKLTIPLINNNQRFNSFRMIPIPIHAGEMTSLIHTEHSHMAVAADRESYFFTSANIRSECIEYLENTYICSNIKSHFTQKETCEWNIMKRKIYDTCSLVKIKPPNKFIELKGNRWIFSFHKEEVCDIVCESITETIKLVGEGLLTMESNCILGSSTEKLYSHGELMSNREESINLDFKINNLPMNTFDKNESDNNINQPGKSKHQAGDFEGIRAQLDLLRNNSKLPMSPNEYNKHDVHHYTWIYVLIGVVAGLGCYLNIRLKQLWVKFRDFQTPIPAPRPLLTRTISMPTI